MVLQVILGAILVALYFFIGAIVYCYNFPADQDKWYEKVLFGYVWPLIVLAWGLWKLIKLPRKIANKLKKEFKEIEWI